MIVSFSNGVNVDAEIPRDPVQGQRGRARAGAMLFDGTSAITMQGMTFPLDLVVFDRAKTVIEVVHGMPPGARWRHAGARAVLEVPAGWARRAGIKPGMSAGWRPFGRPVVAIAPGPRPTLQGLGQCGTDAPVPAGWHTVSSVTPDMQRWAHDLAFSSSTNYGDSFTRTFGTRTILARVEHHTYTILPDGTWKSGCYKGVTLYEGGHTIPQSSSFALRAVEYAGLAAALFGITFTASHALWKAHHERRAIEARELERVKNPSSAPTPVPELETRIWM